MKGYHYSLLCKSEAICLQCPQFQSRYLLLLKTSSWGSGEPSVSCVTYLGELSSPSLCVLPFVLGRRLLPQFSR